MSIDVTVLEGLHSFIVLSLIPSYIRNLNVFLLSLPPFAPSSIHT